MIVVDVEASGTDYAKHSIVSVGALDLANPTNRNISIMASRRCAGPRSRCSVNASSIWLPMVCNGESAIIGSWKMMEMRAPRTPRKSARVSAPGCSTSQRPRSGLSLRHGVTVVNAPGTIDSDYRGEVVVLLVNLAGSALLYTRFLRRGLPLDRLLECVRALGDLPLRAAPASEPGVLGDNVTAGGRGRGSRGSGAVTILMPLALLVGLTMPLP